METAQAVEDGTLSNEHFGIIYRRIGAIIKKLQEGSLTVQFVLSELQRIFEGKRPELPRPIVLDPKLRGQYWEPPRQEFKRPNRKERRKSRSPYNRRLAPWNQRLEWPERNPEHVMAEMWEAENIPEWCSNYGRVPVQAILDPSTVMSYDQLPPHDVMIVASTLQWLGTSVGREFLSRYIRTAQILI